MDNTSYIIRVPKRLGRITAIVGVLALIVAPMAAVATHSFSDVPDSHTFHGNIEWLKASGVTRGCNPPANTLFCPDDNVTRGQMAAFMERFAEYLGAEDGTPEQADNATTADDADNLGGEAPAMYDAFVVGNTVEDTGPLTGVTALTDVTFSNSVATTAAITGTASITLEGVVLVDYDLWAQHNNSTCSQANQMPGSNAQGTVAPSGTEPLNNSVAFTITAPLSSGTHTLTLCGDGGVSVVTAGITAVVSPSGKSVASATTTDTPVPTDR